MLYRKHSLDTVLYPKSILRSLAFWAVPVPTTVVADMLLSAVVTPVFVSSQGSRATFSQGIKRSQLPGIRMMFTDKGLCKPADNIR